MFHLRVYFTQVSPTHVSDTSIIYTCPLHMFCLDVSITHELSTPVP